MRNGRVFKACGLVIVHDRQTTAEVVNRLSAPGEVVFDMGKENSPNVRIISLHTVPIELSALLKFAGLVDSGGAAKQLIRQGLVSVNGEVETRKGKKLNAGDRVTLGSETLVIETA